MKDTGRNFKIGSMQWQLISRFLLLFAVLLGVMGIAQFLITREYLYRSREQLLESRYHMVEAAANSITSEEMVSDLSQYLVENSKDKNISSAVINKEGVLILASDDEAGEIEKKNFTQNDYIRLINKSGNPGGYRLAQDTEGNRVEIIWRKLGGGGACYGLIQLSTSVQTVEDTLISQLYVYALASVLIILIGGLLSRGVLTHTLKPLRNMTDTARKITVGQLDRRLPENNGQTEVDELSTAFNGMLERIRESFDKERYLKMKMNQFISDASHELRTPLTSIHGFVEVLLRGTAKNKKQLDAALNSILTESERLSKLVGDLLLITRLDQQAPLEMSEENLDRIIEEIYPHLSIISGERRLDLQLEKDVIIMADRNRIKQVIYNLVHNAILHTDMHEGVITVSLISETTGDKRYAVLKVSDNGAGIPKKDLGEIFDRFFRSESHRSRKQGGYGLGLSIVKSIVDAHNGEISVESELGKGTVFTVKLLQLSGG